MFNELFNLNLLKCKQISSFIVGKKVFNIILIKDPIRNSMEKNCIYSCKICNIFRVVCLDLTDKAKRKF